ncbi:hypothetical protein, partial [Nocardia brasiliensis]|uniref:hypothetical protein n=1 Tax=Nocardia brasiliensis TaxID=37326 RepID=UPI002458815B
CHHAGRGRAPHRERAAVGAALPRPTAHTFYCAAAAPPRGGPKTDDTTTLVLAVADGLAVRRAPNRPRRT